MPLQNLFTTEIIPTTSCLPNQWANSCLHHARDLWGGRQVKILASQPPKIEFSEIKKQPHDMWTTAFKIVALLVLGTLGSILRFISLYHADVRLALTADPAQYKKVNPQKPVTPPPVINPTSTTTTAPTPATTIPPASDTQQPANTPAIKIPRGIWDHKGSDYFALLFKRKNEEILQPLIRALTNIDAMENLFTEDLDPSLHKLLMYHHQQSINYQWAIMTQSSLPSNPSATEKELTRFILGCLETMDNLTTKDPTKKMVLYPIAGATTLESYGETLLSSFSGFIDELLKVETPQLQQEISKQEELFKNMMLMMVRFSDIPPMARDQQLDQLIKNHSQLLIKLQDAQLDYFYPKPERGEQLLKEHGLQANPDPDFVLCV